MKTIDKFTAALIRHQQGGAAEDGHRAVLLDQLRPAAAPTPKRKTPDVKALLDNMTDDTRAALAAHFANRTNQEEK